MTQQEESVARANELYWDTDMSVNRIADELDLSKGALYERIEPLSTGRSCPDCGEAAGIANRTDRDRRRASCEACGWKGSATETTEPAAEPARSSPDDDEGGSGPSPRRRSPRPAQESENGATRDAAQGGAGVEDEAVSAPVARTAATPPPPRPRVDMRTVAGGALIGAAVGLAFVLWSRGE